jgi:ATP-dependent RNA helicase HelY
LRSHPCHACPDREQHARWAERHARLSKENDALRGRIEGRTGSLGRMFDRICDLLDARGYLAGEEATPAGRQLARIWSEADLLIAECLRDGAWDGLDPAELAAVASTLVYEPRRDEPVVDRLPSEAVDEALRMTERIWSDLGSDEEASGLQRTREPQHGFVWAAYRWARQDRLDRVLTSAAQHGTELSAGDFIRWCKQVLDLLDQIANAPSPSGTRAPVATSARAAIDAIRRGVVAQSMQA